MKTRVVLTVAVISIWGLFSLVYGVAQGPVEGAAALGQLANDDATYAASRAVASGQWIPGAVNMGSMLALILIWGPALVRSGRRSGKTSLLALAMFVLAFGSSACGPPLLEKVVEIAPSETAFMVKLEGDTKTGQDAFQSEEFLEERKVAVKRVSLPQRKISTGRFWFSFKWLPTAQVIKVDRKPVTREWTKEETTGTGEKSEAVHVESKDSIGFRVGVNITTSIPESWASKFLYNFAGKTLSEVTDENVRGFIQASLSREFGSRDLDTGREEKKVIFDVAFAEAHAYFEKKGVSVDYMGFAEGLVYDDQVIQDAINLVFQQTLDVEAARQEKLAQVERNSLMVAKARAERESAQEFDKARAAAVARIDLEIRGKQAQALLVAAEKWNGSMPAQILPEGSSFLFGLDVNKPGG